MIKSIEQTIEEFELTKTDINKISELMHKDTQKYLRSNPTEWEKNYQRLFRVHTIKYINSKKNIHNIQ